MRILFSWLQSYFDDEIPSPQEISEMLTMHSYEVESIEEKDDDFIFNINVLPDRSHDSLSYWGIAKEVSTLTGKKLKKKYSSLSVPKIPQSQKLILEIENQLKCPRFSALVIEGVEVKQSPEWLRKRLKMAGQRAINNIVDITNYVMLSTGQPLHAYDGELIDRDENGWKIKVRNAFESEGVTGLDGKKYKLSNDDLVISDGVSDKALGIAGLKGGKASEISNSTKTIIIESANFNPINIRNTSKKILLRTDASIRFENGISPELTVLALNEALELLKGIAGENLKIEGLNDLYPIKRNPYKIGVSLSEINGFLGVEMKNNSVEKILQSRGFDFTIVKPLEDLVSVYSSLMNASYKLGASISFEAPEKFDCSSFVSYIFTQLGISIPRMTVDQLVFCDSVLEKDLKFGDLVFASSGSGKVHYESVEYKRGTKIEKGVDHVGIYLGNGEVVHISKNGVKKEIIANSESFKNYVVGFGRVPFLLEEERFVVTVPPERVDMLSKPGFLVSGNREDLIEEIGRSYGYQKINPSKIETYEEGKQKVDERSYYKDLLVEQFCSLGLSEIYTYAFRNSGEEELINPIAGDKSFLRVNLKESIKESLDFNLKNAELLGLSFIGIFEIGEIYPSSGESTSICIGIKNVSGNKLINENTRIEEILNQVEKKTGLNLKNNGVIEGGIYEGNFSKIISNTSLVLPLKQKDYISPESFKYKQPSSFPFVLRDVSVFVPQDVSAEQVEEVIKSNGGNLIQRIRLFDIYKKENENEEIVISYAFRIVFQSSEKTLTDNEVNALMEGIVSALNKVEKWQVR